MTLSSSLYSWFQSLIVLWPTYFERNLLYWDSIHLYWLWYTAVCWSRMFSPRCSRCPRATASTAELCTRSGRRTLHLVEQIVSLDIFDRNIENRSKSCQMRLNSRQSDKSDIKSETVAVYNLLKWFANLSFKIMRNNCD